MLRSIQLLAAILSSGTIAHAETETDETANRIHNQWKLTHVWAQQPSGNETGYGTLIANTSELRTYILCRDGQIMDTTSESEELEIYTDNERVGVNNASLPPGSCAVVTGKKVVLWSRQPRIANPYHGHYFEGSVAPLDNETLQGFHMTPVSSDWTMDWYSIATDSKPSSVLISGVPGFYELCIHKTKQFPEPANVERYVTAQVLVDGQPVQGFGKALELRTGNCVFLEGEDIEVGWHSMTSGTTSYRVTGTLWKISDRLLPNQ